MEKKEAIQLGFCIRAQCSIGNVRTDGIIDLSPQIARHIEEAFKALPNNWEYFSLHVLDNPDGNDWSSNGFPGVNSISSKDVLVHPSYAVKGKAYAGPNKAMTI